MEYLQNGLRNVMIFFEDGKWHYIFGFMWFLSQSRWCFLRNFPKTVFLRFFIVFAKWPSYIKNRLGPLFFTTKPTYSLNLVKNGKAVWSESLVEVAALDRKQKWTITLQWRIVFATKINAFATRLSFALHYFASLGPDLRVSPPGRSLSLWKLEYVRHRENNVANELWNWFQQNKRSRGIFL